MYFPEYGNSLRGISGGQGILVVCTCSRIKCIQDITGSVSVSSVKESGTKYQLIRAGSRWPRRVN